MLYLSTLESSPSTHSPLPQPPSPCIPSAFHPSFHTAMIYNQYSCTSWELISRELRLVPILSVGAITIRLWIISLDHCFPLLCWLGAIHLPPPPESQPLLNCLSPSLLFLLFYPHLPSPSHTSWSSSVLLCTTAFIEKQAALEPKPVASVYRPFRTEEIPLTFLPSSHADLYLSRQTRWHILHVICERSHQMTNGDAISPQMAFHNRHWMW